MRRFEVYCPAGWTHVDLDQDVARSARSLALVTVPDDAIEGRAALVGRVTHQLETAFATLAEGGVWSIMMPVTGPTAIAVRPTVVFAPLSLPPERHPMDAVVALAASDPTAEVIDIDPLVALRTSRTDDVTDVLEARASAVVEDMVADRPVETSAATAGSTSRALARRVRYVLGDAEDDDNWVDVLFSVTHLDEPDHVELADAAVDAFDALVKTFRWRS